MTSLAKFSFAKKKKPFDLLLESWRLPHSVPWNEALTPCSCAHNTHKTRPSFCELYFCCLGKHSQTETGFKRNFLPIKGENPITSYCIVLTFKSAKMRWLVKEIWVFWSIGYVYFSWMMTASIKLLTQMMNKLVRRRRRVKLYQTVMATLRC